MDDFFDVTCERRGHKPVKVFVGVPHTEVDGIDVTASVACEKAERKARDAFGGKLEHYFASKAKAVKRNPVHEASTRQLIGPRR